MRGLRCHGRACSNHFSVFNAFVALLIRTLLSDIDASKGEVERHRLVQRIALLEARIQDLESQQTER